MESESSDVAASLIAEAMDAATLGRAKQMDPGSGTLYYSTPHELLMFASPSVQGWVTVWGSTHKFFTFLARRAGMDMLFLGGGDSQEPIDAEDDWEYLIWSRGNIRDWHIPRPVPHFCHMWAQELAQLAVDYIHGRKGIAKPRELSPDGFEVLVRQHADLFRGSRETLAPHLRAGVQESDFRSWLKLPAWDVMEEARSILNHPFLDPRYDILGLALWHDNVRGVLPPMTQEALMDEEPHDNAIRDQFRLAARLPSVDQILPVAFRPRKEMPRLQFYSEFSRPFYYL